MDHSTEHSAATEPAAPKGKVDDAVRRLEARLAEREQELQEAQRAVERTQAVATERLLTLRSALSELQEYVRYLEEHAWSKKALFDRAVGAFGRLAPWGTLRAQLLGYSLSALGVPLLGALHGIARLFGRGGAKDQAARLKGTYFGAADNLAERAGHAEASPFISVIVPVYNAERFDARYLVGAFESIAAQTYREFEVIVVDDGSTDGSSPIVEQFMTAHPEIKMMLLHKANGGQSSARNVGVAHATGPWLAFLDQDDIWLPERLQASIPFLTEDIDLVYTDADTMDENGEILVQGIHSRMGAGGKHPKTSVYDCIYRDCFVTPGVMTTRKEFFQRLGGFDERLSGYEDDDLFVRAIGAGRVDYVPISTLRWRFYGENFSRSRRMVDSRLYYWEKLLRDYAGGGTDRVVARRVTLRFLREFLHQCDLQLGEGDPLAKDNLAAALKLLPYVGPIDRAAFRLVRWAWSRRGYFAGQARLWFKYGLEAALPTKQRDA
jgi:glycosyltransferase involved in cell wall biosynthesis